VRAVHETLMALREGTSPSEIKTVASSELMKRVTREAEYDKWNDAFLRPS
jgi:oxaloacetate decarboxylase